MKKILLFLFAFLFFTSTLKSQNLYGSGVCYSTNNGNIYRVELNAIIQLSELSLNLDLIKPIVSADSNTVTFMNPEILYFNFVTTSNLVNVYPYNSTNELPPGAKTNVSQVVTIPFYETLNEWQNSKSTLLKQVENLYVDFLTNDWTLVLRDKAIIATNVTITVDSTSESQNMTYLMQLRSLDKNIYYNMAGEFDRFKSVIIENGGIMSRVIKHE